MPDTRQKTPISISSPRVTCPTRHSAIGTTVAKATSRWLPQCTEIYCMIWIMSPKVNWWRLKLGLGTACGDRKKFWGAGIHLRACLHVTSSSIIYYYIKNIFCENSVLIKRIRLRKQPQIQTMVDPLHGTSYHLYIYIHIFIDTRLIQPYIYIYSCFRVWFIIIGDGIVVRISCGSTCQPGFSPVFITNFVSCTWPCHV